MGKCLKQGTKAKNELGVLLQRIKKALFSILKKEHNSLLPKLELCIVTLSPTPQNGVGKSNLKVENLEKLDLVR